ncbi:unnamed protein product [Sphagnum jensenii]|uniref:Uncharacterized protein n=1 Tax=Sphagnum jensenii TaxID=128206 RepID=A0ABP0WYR3_9BRYO
MADSWPKYLYQEHTAFAVNPLKSKDSVRLLDVLVKTSGTGSRPILHNIGSMFKLGSRESQETADRLREGLRRFESNEEREEDDEELFKLDRGQLTIKHRVESRASVKSSLRIFGDAANLDIDGDKHLECQLQGVQIAAVDRAALEEIICEQQWKPDVPKLRKLKHWSEPRDGVLHFFGESKQDLWVIYEILQAKKVILEPVDSHSGAVGADVTTVVPVGGPPVGANLRMSTTGRGLFEFTVPDNKVRAFGFRAIHARYDSTGEFSSFVHVEKWSHPTVRGPQQSENIDPRRDLVDLFLKPPADMQDDNGDDIECLEIVASNLAEELDE